MELVNLPIYRAKKLGSDKYVEGFLNKAYESTENKYGDIDDEIELTIKYFIMSFIDNEFSDEDMWNFKGFHEIDLTTLAISFDNGETWYDDFESINQILVGNY